MIKTFKFLKLKEKWKRSFRKRFSQKNPALYYIKRILSSEYPLIIDVGAHVGQSSMEYLEVFKNPSIQCIEPCEESFEILVKRFCDDKRVKCFNIGFADKNEKLNLNINHSSDTNSFLDFTENAGVIWQDSEHFQTKSCKQIECFTLDAFCSQQRINQIDILKLDAQGFEKNILIGGIEKMKSNEINFIYTEVSFQHTYKDQTKVHEVFEILYNHNFEVFNFFENVTKSSQLIQANILFINKKFKNSKSSILHYLV